MAKKKTLTRPSATAGSSPSPRALSGWLSAGGIRESIESLAVAFILAFLFRTFEAEAFVIPTGSMAPTLMGQHKDLLCPECGYRYQAGASSESEDLALQRGRQFTQLIAHCSCPICRYTADVDPKTAEGREYPTYPGDRILVSKLTYEFAEPNRWDVIVFRFPGEAQVNYIKRLIGLPEETVRIEHGDISLKKDGTQQFLAERRSPAKLRAMAQIVYDNDYIVDDMTKKGWPLRWQAWPAGEKATAGAWSSADGGRAFAINGSAAGTQWIRYQHLVPTIRDWDKLDQNAKPSEIQARPRLITDFYAYNTSTPRDVSVAQPALVGTHWVGDLLLECQVDVKTPGGRATLDLVKGGKHFRCELNCETGEARLMIDGMPDFHPTAQTAARGVGSHHLVFGNVDGQLLLWVDGSVASFDNSTVYPPLNNDRPRSNREDPGDLAAAGIGSEQVGLEVSHIRLWRDIYYIAESQGSDPLSDYGPKSPLRMNYNELVEFFSSPRLWEPPNSPFDNLKKADFPLSKDQFFVLGDNSPASADARLWGDEKYVSRELLIGKALLVFWPHSFHQIPGTSIPLPFFPNFARMRPIR